MEESPDDRDLELDAYRFGQGQGYFSLVNYCVCYPQRMMGSRMMGSGIEKAYLLIFLCVCLV